jgi:hypothetical protein
MAGLLSPSNGQDAEDRQSLISIKSVNASPDTLTSKPYLLFQWLELTFTELINRLRALTLALLPVEVDPKSINGPTSRAITPQVVSAYKDAAGDFVEAVSDLLDPVSTSPC